MWITRNVYKLGKYIRIIQIYVYIILLILYILANCSNLKIWIISIVFIYYICVYLYIKFEISEQKLDYFI